MPPEASPALGWLGVPEGSVRIGAWESGDVFRLVKDRLVEGFPCGKVLGTYRDEITLCWSIHLGNPVGVSGLRSLKEVPDHAAVAEVLAPHIVM